MATKIVSMIEPFHRMFSLDNLSIQYPHADVERVSVCKFALSPLPQAIANHIS